MLDIQHRMHARICDLIAEPMYNGRLATGNRTNQTRPAAPFETPITLVDTSSLFPFVGFDETGSRFNLMHAIVVRNIVKHLANHDVREVGVAAGYRAQARLIGHFLEDAGCSHCVSGTVHRFQGDEKHVMVIDLPEGQGDYGVGRFLHGESPDDVGPRLLNVAVSRAKDHLVFVINRRFLDRKLPGNAVVREILYRAQSGGQVVDAARVLALAPLQPADLAKPGAFDRPPPRGLYNQDEFDAALRADLAHARHSVIIYSAFITASRSARYGDEFRRLIASGVMVRCVTRPPTTNGADSPENTRAALEALRAIDCAVDLRAGIHHKVVAIDERILWVGSLNPLSFTPNTEEIMVRTECKESAREVLGKLALPKAVSAAKHFHEAENPTCGACGHPTVWFQRGRTRMFFCIDEACSWRVFADTVHQKASQPVDPSIPKEGPACPESGGPTTIRSSRSGSFYGCCSYPECKGTAPVGGSKAAKRRNPTPKAKRSEKE